MFIRTIVIASAALVLLASMAQVEAHSWADCVDWRFNDPSNPSFAANGGACYGWGRKYPAADNVFGTLDSANPARHYEQTHNQANPVPCSDMKSGVEPGSDETRQNPISKSYGGQYRAMATAHAGQQICVRWPAKNHAVPSERERGVYINMPQTLLSQDPDQITFLNSTIAKIPYKNCNQIPGDTDHTPCGGCFTVPSGLQSGNYVIQWRWQLNDGEFYTSCWDLGVTAAGDTLGASTSVFAHLAAN